MIEPVDPLAKFIEAADTLVNHLATTPPTSPSAKRRLQRSIDEAYDRYEAAREALLGDEPEPDTSE